MTGVAPGGREGGESMTGVPPGGAESMTGPTTNTQLTCERGLEAVGSGSPAEAGQLGRRCRDGRGIGHPSRTPSLSRARLGQSNEPKPLFYAHRIFVRCVKLCGVGRMVSL